MPSSRRRSRAVRAVTVLVLVGVALVVAFAALGRGAIAHAIVDAPNRNRRLGSEDEASPAELAGWGADRSIRVAIDETRGLALSAWIAEPRSAPLGTVLVLHGIRSDRRWLMGLARRIADEGYRAVAPDLRGHGRSGGDWLTYGVADREDLRALLDRLAQTGELAGRVGVVGTSYGAAVALQLAAADPRVTAVVAIAPFTSLRDVVPEYAAHYLPGVAKLVPDAFLADAIAEAGRLGRFDPDAASPIAAIATTRAHVLLLHGAEDRHIPVEHSRRLAAAAPDRAELVVVAGEGHESIMGDATGAIAGAGVRHLHRWVEGEGR